jgi:hypothetical protein
MKGIAMTKRSRVMLPLLCLAAGSALWPMLGLAGDQDALKTIPINAEPPKSAAVVNTDTDTSEDNTRSFNTPMEDGRPGEYYFALGVQAVKKGDFVHAIAMYKVAASWAYKPAEYNLGVMYLNGQGAPADLPQAMAWMALAAERDDPQYLHARQLVYAHLTPEQFAKANEIWRGLLPTYGDEAALPRAKARWREVRQNATGSRVGSAAAHVEVGGVAGDPNHMNSPNYDVHDGGHTTSNPGELAGVHQTDSSVAYQQLRATDNPYDPKITPVSGSVAVGALTPVQKKDGDATKDDSTPTDAGNPGHP